MNCKSLGGGTEEKLPKESEAGRAIYPGKEDWKDEGNRYTPEELRAMQRNWDVELVNPDRPHCCDAE